MDEEWALQQLNEFVELTRLEQPSSDGGVVFLGDFGAPIGSQREIVTSAQVVEQLLDRVIPRWRTEIDDDGKKRWSQHREAAIRAIAQVRQRAEVAARLGDDAPSVSASSFHHWVWEGARSLWQSGYYAEAVRAASVKLNAETQLKLGRRDIAEQALFQEAFSGDAAQSGRARLRPPGDDGGKTAKSVRRGITAFAEGWYAAVRNPASHDVIVELSEQVALEQLAALSLLARWVDEAAVERA